MLHRFRTSTRRPRYSVVSLLTLIGLLALQSGSLAQFQTTLDSPSPASGHASVIAQGVAEMPFDPIAWRVVLDTAEPLDVALPVERALGFVVADPDGVHVVDVTAGTQERLAVGEASFVPEAAAQTRASLADTETRYLRIALVAEEDAGDPGNDELVFAGGGFTAPDGRRDIDLLSDVLAADEETTIAGGEYPVLIVATGGAILVEAGGQIVELQAGEAAEFTGNITVTGMQDGSRFVAGVIGPEVPVPPRTSATISVATFICSPGTEPADVGDPLDSDVAANCTAAPDDVVPSLTDPNGETLDTEAAERLRGGAYGWIGVPFGDYTVNVPTELPGGVGNPTFYDGDGNLLASGELTVDREEPDAHIDLYLFQSGSGSVSLTAYVCPAGWSYTEGNRADCDLIADGFGITFAAGDDEGGEFSLSDADYANGTYLWTGLGLSPNSDTVGAGYYVVSAVTAPGGYSGWAIDGANIVPDAEGSTYVNLTSASPEANLALYFLIDAAPVGTITLDMLECPSLDSALEACARTTGPAQLGGIYIQDVNGEYGALTGANATQDGASPFVWPRVPLASYFMDTSALAAPAGQQIIAVVLTPDGSDVSNGFTITEDNSIANIIVFVAPVNGGGSAVDSDNDGLSDEAETELGTDPYNPDTDGDCHADGPEVNAGTDPLDASSFPDGDCDMIESTDGN